MNLECAEPFQREPPPFRLAPSAMPGRCGGSSTSWRGPS